MLPGFLPFSRASFAIDVVALTTLAVVPLLAWSIYLVRYEKNYALHRKIQLTLAGLLLGAVVLFELEVRIFGWRQFAEPSPFYDTILFPVLYVHLFFAISTPLPFGSTRSSVPSDGSRSRRDPTTTAHATVGSRGWPPSGCCARPSPAGPSTT